MKVIDYINKKSTDRTIYIISKNSLAVVSSSDYASQQRKLYANAVQHAENQNNKRSRNNRRGKNNYPNTIYYGKIQYLLKNKGMMSWISDIDILEEVSYPVETVKAKKEYELPELERIEI